MKADLFKLFAENSPLACFVFDRERNCFSYENRAFRELVESETMPTEPGYILSLLPGKEMPYLERILNSASEGVHPESIESTLVFPGTHEKWVQVFPISVGQQGLISGYARDITAERRNVESIRKYANKKNSILTILAHDLAGPLGVAQNVLTVLDRKVEDPSLKKLISNLARTNVQSINLINDLVQRELLDTTGEFLFKKRVNVVSKLKEMVEEYKISEEFSKRNFGFRASSDSILLDLDEPKFIQIINNLMSNALKFTHAEGSIEISIEEKDQGVLFAFSDNGIGIPEKFHPVIFDKFTSAGRPGLQGEPTIGLGLAIIKTIIEWHKGRIWFKSVENQGTTFYFEIPF